MNNIQNSRTSSVKRKSVTSACKPQFNVKDMAASDDAFSASSIVNNAFQKLEAKAFAFPDGMKIKLSH